MATFDARTASNSPEVTDPEAVRAIIARWYPSGEDLSVEVDSARGTPTLEFYGYGWPEMVRKPEGAGEEWTPWDEVDFDGEDELQAFMLEVAPFLKDEWVIQAIGGERCRFPLASCELVVEPGGTEVTVHHLGN